MSFNKISADAGHNAYPDTGASGIRQEDELTKEVWELVQTKLNDLGYKTVDCTPYNQRFSSVGQSLQYRVNKANASGSDLHLCIHFNAGGGSGVEMWVDPSASNETKKVAQAILDEIIKLGYRNRGVKSGNLYIPRSTNMPCVLLECAFVDSKEDMARYNANDLANAIVKAVTGKAASNNSSNSSSSGDNSQISNDGKPNKAAINVDLTRDSWVMKLQQELNNQFKAGLAVDGIAGPKTLAASPILKKGAKGNITKLLQEKLVKLGYNTNGIDGIFGNGTYNAVVGYQKSKGLSADGIVGKNTWTKILGL